MIDEFPEFYAFAMALGFVTDAACERVEAMKAAAPLADFLAFMPLVLRARQIGAVVHCDGNLIALPGGRTMRVDADEAEIDAEIAGFVPVRMSGFTALYSLDGIRPVAASQSVKVAA